MKQFQILSLGAGVQSTAVFLMSCYGELPMLDAAVFADTQWEPGAVYDNLDRLEIEGEKYGIPLHRITKGDLRADYLDGAMVGGTKMGGKRFASIPVYTLGPKGEKGMIRRQCTREYKIEPIIRELRVIMGYRWKQPIPENTLRQWFGISRDEIPRMRDSRKMWIENWYPLIEGPKPMTRQECGTWLRERGWGVPQRSACICCPFRSNKEWREIRRQPKEWSAALAFDAAIRDQAGLGAKVFLHEDRIPLDEVDIDSLEDKGQRNFLNECEGGCGV